MAKVTEKLSIVIPMFNERSTIAAVLARLQEVAFGMTTETLVIDDGSTDRSGDIVQEFAARDSTITLLRKTNGGKGSAIRAALAIATGTILIVQDADLEYDPGEIPSIVAPIVDGRAAVVFGSRLLRSGKSEYSGLSYYVGGRVLTLITNMLFGASLTDEPTCYKAFRTTLIRSLHLTCEGFEFCPEVTGKILRRGIPILEVPISYRPRSIAEGKKIRARDGVTAIRTLVRERFRRLPAASVPTTVPKAAGTITPPPRTTRVQRKPSR